MNRSIFRRLIASALPVFFLAFLSGPITTMAANPYLALKSSKVITSNWSGHVWGDEIEAPGEDGLPITATCSMRRIAQMSWGQIVRMRFEVTGGQHAVPPLYLLVRDDLILELIPDDGDLEFVIGIVAGMKNAPNFEPSDVRARNQGPALTAKDGAYDIKIEADETTSTYLSSHPSGHFRKMAWQRGAGLIEYAAGYGARKEGFRLRVRDSKVEAAAPAGEGIGGLRPGMSEDAVVALLKAQPFKGKSEHGAVDGPWLQSWQWPHLGLDLSMEAATQTGPKMIRSIELRKEGEFRTRRGIGIGSSEIDALGAYRDILSKDDTVRGIRIVARAPDSTITFDLHQGRVTRMVLVAAAK